MRFSAWRSDGCSSDLRVMVLDHGDPIITADPTTAILAFREKLLGGDNLDSDHVIAHGHRVTRTIRIEDVQVRWPDSAQRRSVGPGENVTVAVRYECDEPTDDVAFAMALRSIDDVTVYGCNTDALAQRTDNGRANVRTPHT